MRVSRLAYRLLRPRDTLWPRRIQRARVCSGVLQLRKRKVFELLSIGRIRHILFGPLAPCAPLVDRQGDLNRRDL